MTPSRSRIETLLEAYYEGTSSQEEEMQLLMLLLEQGHNSPYDADRRMLLATLSYTPQAQDSEPQSAPRNLWHKIRRSPLAGWTVAASCLLFAGISIHQMSVSDQAISPSYHNEISYRNGQPISQDEANRYAQQALYRLSHCIESHAECDDRVSEAFAVLQRIGTAGASSSSNGFIPVSQ